MPVNLPTQGCCSVSLKKNTPTFTEQRCEVGKGRGVVTDLVGLDGPPARNVKKGWGWEITS